MNGKMKAITFHGVGDVRLDEMDIPQIGPKDVLLKSVMTSVCGSDMHPYHVGARMASIPNEIGGHEYIATVAEVGSEVTKYKVGDRVFGHNMAFCGECWYCRHGDFGHCINVVKNYTGRGRAGAFAQYFKFDNPEDPNAFAPYLNSLMVIPDDVSDETVCLVEPFGVGLGAVEVADVKEGQTVVVLGSGIIGNSAMQWAKARGAKVILVGRSKRRLDCARACGADYVIDNTNGDCYEQIAALVGEPHFNWGKHACAVDVVLDCAGYPGSFNDALKIAKCGGTVCCVAYYEDESMVNPMLVTVKDMKVLGMNLCDVMGALAGIQNGAVKIDPLIDEIVPLERYMEAYQRQSDGSAMKVLIDMTK